MGVLKFLSNSLFNKLQLFFSGAEFSTVATKQKEILGDIFHCHNQKKFTCDMYKKGFFWKKCTKVPIFGEKKMHKSSHI
jgi:hypothetical protein